MATNKKSNSRYDLNAQDRKRDLFVKIGLTAVVVAFAVGLVLYIVKNGEKGGELRSVRLESSSLIKKEGTDEPKAVLSIYEDFQCPACRKFEKDFGPTVTKLIDSGAVAADYYLVSILDRINGGYSSRAASAGYCVANENKDAFKRFKSALFEQQPEEGTGSGPDNARLIEVARQAGAAGEVPSCINSDTYVKTSKGLAAAAGVTSTPTIKLNGEDINPAKPEELVAKVMAIVGPVPALMPSPAPGSPAPAPAP